MSELLPIAEIDIIQRYRESHHRVAQMIAAGCTDSFITQTTGRSQRSLMILRADPTFCELIAQYGKRVEAAWAQATDEFADLAIRNMLRSERMVADRLDTAEEEGEKIPLLTLDRIAQGRADRFGYGKHQTVKHEHDFAAMLDRAIDRSGKRTEVKVIDAQAHPVPPQGALPPPRLEAPAELASDPVRPEPQPKPHGAKGAANGVPDGLDQANQKRVMGSSTSFASVLSRDVKRRRVA